MLLSTKVEIVVTPNRRQYWLDKGYEVNIPKGIGKGNSQTKIIVSVNDLPKNSNVRVECWCEGCGTFYSNIWSRYDQYCGKCRTSQHLIGNTFGKTNATIKSPPRDELLEKIHHFVTLQKVADFYNTSLIILKRWLRENDISVDPYWGTKVHLEDTAEFIDDCSTMFMTDILRKYNISRAPVIRLCKELNIDLPKNTLSQSIYYREQVLSLYDDIVDMNKNQAKSIKDISVELNIPISFILEELRKRDQPVILHSYNKSSGELEVRQYISAKGFDCHSRKIKFNDKKFEIDCLVPEKSFGVEYCGEFWHSEENRHKDYHQEKTLWAKRQNINLMTIFEHEWKSKRPILESMIDNRLGISSRKIYARNTNIIDLSNNRKKVKDFQDNNHIQGSINSKINIGLEHDGELVSLLSVSKSRFNKKYQYEITRFCNALNTNVVGGASKLFKYFINNFEVKSCISYADLRFGFGEVYEHLGFIKESCNKPAYWYYHLRKFTFENRMKYQKHKLQKLLKDFDPDLSEVENMRQNNYVRIWDCGNLVYVYNSV